MKEKATSFDIAHHAGVSQSTVSRALRNSPLVNKETREKVQAIARELNYKVDKNASNLRRQHSKTLALLLFEDPTSDNSLINPFFLSMLGSITRASANAGYDLLISFQNLSDDWHAEYEDSNKADGIILLGYGDYTEYCTKLTQLEAQNTHFVRWGALDDEHPGVSIGCDNFQGGFDVTQHLLDLGRKRFAFIGGADSRAPEFFARYQGYHKALTLADVAQSAVQQDAISTEDSGYSATLLLLERHPNIDAIVCASDLIAIGVLRALRDSNISIPQQIAVVGFDNVPVASFATPGLTTVKQDTILAGEILVDSLLRLIAGEEVEHYLMHVDLVIRQSSGA
ncbi:LacI family DNA-binding transcriptional regulator [Paraglaciecola chathamensis]|jgi:DNA-binding LacI/PurR family transcriptional regulator|uniref:LacI family DNA-binding transcriptional regulator n=3 Tax=Paraglaciecola chathamensis TaxID=368405 RepID=A0A8H9IBC6_9ALTE|nr:MULTISPECIES: LacI family DNA-binding transcriptional regulator [Paraglaciecola]AEE23024.1 transcriptional regulator, LacI family [Glaciecola sp. 4H-3-7+YE-5]MBN24425.1 LacI family transcriptional regulator [Alteromonadaceae bacterium]MBJ2137161.1 LacI family DNA-binding transcriptional regulator [Paraglaciecola chathamensis]MBU3019664.1 LacI family DNA-binding transcriptional regulator [Paraglaciecola agarilytica]MDO6841651.1 LacI family DNA-binding transcriptional regulator [Paraglaciecol|tara:strand:+ start:39568 stop:40587 length:1020 start_codon:yes stop_codon:yes gene_type:complete